MTKNTTILDGRAVARDILTRIGREIENLAPDASKPTIAVVLVGQNPASLSYIRMKQKRADEIGMNFILRTFDETIPWEELEQEIRSLSMDTNIHGIIVQAPLPSHIDAFRIVECIPEEKDVDGFTRAQIGNVFLGHDGLWSCTPKGIITLLDTYDIELTGKNVAVVGRSNIVGKPLALMLINRGATVTSCNSHTKNIAEITKNADIVMVAIGKPKWLTRDMVHTDSIVIDVGSNLLADGSFVGDADFNDLSGFVESITPAPGGVGPMTIATLLENTYRAFLAQKTPR